MIKASDLIVLGVQKIEKAGFKFIYRNWWFYINETTVYAGCNTLMAIGAGMPVTGDRNKSCYQLVTKYITDINPELTRQQDKINYPGNTFKSDSSILKLVTDLTCYSKKYRDYHEILEQIKELGY